MISNDAEALIAYLRQFVSDSRWNRFQEVINERTNHIQVVLENIYQAHNSSAVLRSCDCFGIQNVHYIEARNSMRISHLVARGSSTWLDVHQHDSRKISSREILLNIKSQGYRLVATSPHASTTLEELDIDQPFALVFGTERTGISSEVKEVADTFVRIPMHGFTESFNISVSAALCLYELTSRLRKSNINYHLTEGDKKRVLLNWLKHSLENSELLIKRYLEDK